MEGEEGADGAAANARAPAAVAVKRARRAARKKEQVKRGLGRGRKARRGEEKSVPGVAGKEAREFMREGAS